MKKTLYAIVGSLSLIMYSCSETPKKQAREELIIEKTDAHKIATIRRYISNIGDKRERTNPKDTLETLSTYRQHVGTPQSDYYFYLSDSPKEFKDELYTTYDSIGSPVKYVFLDKQANGGLSSAIVISKELSTKDRTVILDRSNPDNFESFQELYQKHINQIYTIIPYK